jgi:hypothetical protein
LSAGGQLEHPSEVKSSINTGLSDAETGTKGPITETTRESSRDKRGLKIICYSFGTICILALQSCRSLIDPYAL